MKRFLTILATSVLVGALGIAVAADFTPRSHEGAVTAGTVSVTNGQAVTLSTGNYVVTGIGGGDNTTNTITLANAKAGQLVVLVVEGSSSNLISIADSGNTLLTGAWIGDNNDTITLLGVGTNWVETSTTDN